MADVRISWLQLDTNATPCDVKVSHLAFDTQAGTCDVKVSWLAFDSDTFPCDVKVSWLQFDTSVPAANDETLQGGAQKKPKKRRPAWVIPPQFIKPVDARREEDEALLLCGVI